MDRCKIKDNNNLWEYFIYKGCFYMYRFLIVEYDKVKRL